MVNKAYHKRLPKLLITANLLCNVMLFDVFVARH